MGIARRHLLYPVVAVLAACYPPLYGAQGAHPAAPSSGTEWKPPASAASEARQSKLADDTLPGTIESRRDQLTTSDLVSIALQRNPQTRATWLAAKSAAASYDEARGQIFPDLTGSVGINRLQTAATQGRVSSEETTYGPSITINWLLLDFGGRAGTIEAAEQTMFSLNWTHNAEVADITRQTLQQYFAYVGARGLLAAQRASLNDAQVNLTAAQDRRSVGVATIADVLQAQTAVGQAQLTVQQAAGTYAMARGALATLIGLPPTARFDVDTSEATAPIAAISETVDSLMAQGLLSRPDLAAERANADARRAEVRIARSAIYPSVAATATGGILGVSGSSQTFPSYNVGLAINLPIFNGFGWQYAAEAASFTADAETARLRSLEQQVALQVFDTYQALRTATQSVATSEDLYTSASQSVEAARARYQQGVGSLLELLTAEASLATARAQRIQAHVDWHTSLVQLAHDAGLLLSNGSTGLHLAPITTTAPGNNR